MPVCLTSRGTTFGSDMLIRKIILTASLFLNLVLVYALIWGQRGIIAYKELREHCDTLSARIQVLGEEELALSQEIRLLKANDDKYLENLIRNRLNFVRENEILYIFPLETAGSLSGAPFHETKD